MAEAPRMKGVLFVLILLFVAYFGGMFFLPPCLLLWLIPYGGNLARRGNDYSVTLWLRLVPALIEVVFGVKVKICGDLKPLKGPCLIILNHRTRFDWMFLWCFLMRMGDLNKHKIILKKSLKKIPPFGWAMQTAHFLFISRNWAEDKQYLSDNFSYFNQMDYPLQLLIFPEGTDLSQSNKEKSQKYAKEKGLQPYEYVLHPRSKGFVHCINEMRKFKTAPTIIDMTVGYVGAIPQNERDILFGNWPREIHFYSKQAPPSEIPTDETQLEEWLTEKWVAKEEQLKEFYTKNRFSASYMSIGKTAEPYTEMKWLLAFWVVFFAHLAYSLATSSFYWVYLPLWTVFFLLWNMITKGTDDLIVRRYVKRQTR